MLVIDAIISKMKIQKKGKKEKEENSTIIFKNLCA